MTLRKSFLYAALGLLAVICVASTPAAAEGVFYIVDGKAGVGTDNPDEDLHVYSDSGSAELLIEEESSVNARRPLMRLENNGPVQFKFSDGTNTWIFAHRGAGFEINKGGTGDTQFKLEANGDGKFLGDVISKGVKLTSSRAKKEEFDLIDSREILAKVSTLPISEWSFKADRDGTRHIGPMAEDFHATFGVGDDNTHIAVTDANGVTLAALQGLHLELQDRDAEIESLHERLKELENLVETLVDSQVN